MATLRRPARISAAPKSTVNQEYSYPDGPPTSDIERWVSKLDLQSFPSQDYARIDDILVYALFGIKRSSRHYRALLPSRVFLQDSPLIPIEIGLDICNTYLSLGRDFAIHFLGPESAPHTEIHITFLRASR